MVRKSSILYLLVLLALSCHLYGESLQVSEGVLDLRFKELSGVYPLVGEWDFQNDRGEASLIKVPGGWESNTGYNLGRGVYSLTILNDHRPGGESALLLTKLNQNLRVYINGNLVFDSISTGNTFLNYTRSVIPVPKEDIVKIIIPMDNSFFRRGGMHHAILFGPYSRVLKYKYGNMIRESAISGILFFLFLYNLFLFINHFSIRSSLYLSLVSLFFALRGLLSGELLMEMLLSDIMFDYQFRWDYILLYLGVVCIILFVWTLFNFESRILRLITRLFIMTGLILTLITLLISRAAVSRSIFILQGYGLLGFFYGIFLLLIQIRKGEHEARLIFLGSLVFFCFACLDIYTIHRGKLLYELTQQGLLFFLLSDFLVLTRKFGKAYLKADKLSRELEKEVARQTRELKELSRTDPLTGINNRRRFFELGRREIGIHKRQGRPLSLLMFDLDYFKKINDRYGHSIGDKALIFTTELCREEVRASDIFGRLGGEEFALILLETELEKARETAERIRSRLEISSTGRSDGIPPMTMSIGIISFKPDESLEEGLERADNLMYEAKEGGRNRIVG